MILQDFNVLIADDGTAAVDAVIVSVKVETQQDLAAMFGVRCEDFNALLHPVNRAVGTFN